MGTGLEAVSTVPAPDDAGARTADLYEWQAAAAAADGLALLHAAIRGAAGDTPAEGVVIVCEHHEDWVIVAGDRVELVSAKHREPSSGAWTTINDLVTEGGIGHLFERWLTLSSGSTSLQTTSRLVTCAGLAPGAPQRLAEAAEQLRSSPTQNDESINEVVRDLARSLIYYGNGLPPEWIKPPDAKAPKHVMPTATHEATARSFVASLTIDCSRPNRHVLPYAAPNMYAKPLLERMGKPTVPPEALWEAVLPLFRVRMRAQAPAPGTSLPPVVDVAAASVGARADSQLLARRALVLSDLSLAVSAAVRNPRGYLPIADPPRVTPLGIKMSRGGCSATSIERAEALRLHYRQFWRSRRGDAPGSLAGRPAMDRSLLRLADEATAEVASEAGPWGDALWRRLCQEVEQHSNVQGGDADVALGGVCELAANCKVWFSESFDVDAEVTALRRRRGLDR